MNELKTPLDIPEQDMSPTVQRLLAFIEQQNALIRHQGLQIQLLKDEIARLKNQPPRPKIKHQQLGKEKIETLSIAEQKAARVRETIQDRPD